MDSVALFKALGNHSRLAFMHALLERPHTAEELCERLKLVPSTVSHHAKNLSEVGLVISKKAHKEITYHVNPETLSSPLIQLIKAPLEAEKKDGRSARYTHEVLSHFMDCGKLLAIPRQRKKRRIILEHMVEALEPDRQYPEKELNTILNGWHEDHCFLRREMIAEGLLARKAGVYWRVA